MKKLLTTVIPSQNARFLLSRLIIIESDNEKLMLDHSFVKDTAKNLDFMKSKIFREFIESLSKRKPSNRK